MSRLQFFFFAASFFLSIAVFAQSPSLSSHQTRLSNGMDVVLVENHSVPMIACNVVIRTGAREESWETWGAAHFLEHLLFNGTESRTQDEIYARFDNLGAYHNAHTGSHYIDFMLLTASENFAAGFDILTDMVFNSTLPPEKFEKERGIVMEEIARSAVYKSEDDDTFRETLFGRTPLSREVLGTTQSIAKLDRDSVLAFYRRWYVPNNMLLFVTGSFRSDTMAVWLERALSGFAPHNIPAHAVIPPPNYEAFARLGILQRSSDGKEATLRLAFAAPLPGDPEYLPFSVALDVLTDRLNDRLSGAQVSANLTLDPDLAVCEVNITLPGENPDPDAILALFDKTVTELVKKPPKPDEIARRALNLRADRTFTSERLHYYGIVNAQYWALMSWDQFAQQPIQLANLTGADVARAAGWLNTPDRLAMAFMPPPKGGDKPAQSGGELLRTETPLGAVVIVRDDPTARVFALHLLARDRWQWDARYGKGAVDALHQALERAAQTPEFRRRLESAAIEIKLADDPRIPYDNYYTSPEYSFIRIETLPEYWRDAVAVAADLCNKITLTPQLAKEGVKASHSAGEAAARSPVSQGRALLRQKLIPGTALAADVYGDSESTLQELNDLRNACFQPRNLILTASGPISRYEVTRLLHERFDTAQPSGDLRLAEASGELIPVQSDLKVSRDTLRLGAAQGALLLGSVITRIDSADAAALILANVWINDRMDMDIREGAGLAYSLGSALILRKGGDGNLWGWWELNVATRKDNLTQAESRLRALLDSLTNGGIAEDELQRLKNALKGRLAMRAMPRMGQAFNLAMGEFYWDDPTYDERLLDRLSSETAASVARAMHSYLAGGEFYTVLVE